MLAPECTYTQVQINKIKSSKTKNVVQKNNYLRSIFSFLKYFIPANKDPPMAKVNAKDFQETGYWGREFNQINK